MLGYMPRVTYHICYISYIVIVMEKPHPQIKFMVCYGQRRIQFLAPHPSLLQNHLLPGANMGRKCGTADAELERLEPPWLWIHIRMYSILYIYIYTLHY